MFTDKEQMMNCIRILGYSSICGMLVLLYDTSMHGEFLTGASIARSVTMVAFTVILFYVLERKFAGQVLAKNRELMAANLEITAANEELTAFNEELEHQFDVISDIHEKLSIKNAVLESLNQTALGLMGDLELTVLLSQIVNKAAQLTQTSHGYIALIDKEPGWMVLSAGIGYYQDLVNRQQKVEIGIAGEVYKTGQAIVVDDYSSWHKRLPDHRFDCIKSVIRVPIKSGNKVIGILGLTYLEPARQFSVDDVEFLKGFAELASIALKNSELYMAAKHELAQRQQTEARNRALLDSIPDMMLVVSGDGHILEYKQAAATSLNVQSHEVVGLNIRAVIPSDIADQTILYITKTLQSGALQQFEYQYQVDALIAERFFEARFIPIDNDNIMIMVRDITERKLMEQKLAYLGLHDALTGLYNRAFFEEESNRYAKERGTQAGLVMCDVDGLKLINDTLGHKAGDEILVAAAQAIKQAFRVGDIVARIGGDEFAVLALNAGSSELEKAKARINDNIAQYNSAGKNQIPLSISIGFAWNEEEPFVAEKLFKEADNNMYCEKLHHSQSAKSSIVQVLTQALDERNFQNDSNKQRIESFIADLVVKLGLEKEKLADLMLFAKFRDIGNVGIPDDVLFKSQQLTAEEYDVMKRHCEIGYRIARSSTELAPIADWILKHQEWWNGKGYPLGLQGQDIPLESRILSIVDAYIAMTSDRPYRRRMTTEEAIEELRRGAGSQFDSKLVEVFLSIDKLYAEGYAAGEAGRGREMMNGR